MSKPLETVLRAPRLVSTMLAARAFSRSPVTPASTDGQQQFRMRSAMDLDPRLGKWVSRRSIHTSEASESTQTHTSSSRVIDSGEIEPAVTGLAHDGYYVFENLADVHLVDAIRKFALQVPCRARGEENDSDAYPRERPLAGRYDFTEEVALRCPEVQEYLTDPVAAEIARQYLRQSVIMDSMAFWWTTPMRPEDASLNAQQFHQDRDRLSFLKFFIYLTDVDSETGPHVYVQGTHRHLPWALRGDGRKSDESVSAAGLAEQVNELCGAAGTVLAVDTIGLHKGKTPTTGDRLILQSQYATSLFGADYERPLFSPSAMTSDRYAASPWTLQRLAGAIRA
ncbi:MAG: phytanoyl-CoA dioxygenase family protein [Candidatus Nanopelagicales bacterium]|nr:phytanoyl-CoA dioxygenase family protein [Candidatus Nanopelagicales bacterium]MCF8536797.1 phytanoyl-CoA dioxygenase family protein [Candidatus Nanopelagicales bacterium]MCF8541782.1 phytanoyl-CoA dioxygenase family protein [Candidatus Nanopelagicales bacterium]MCF8556177.1 phytanoyl-CoA dioxygenase family protein [Candidatus Nanopelagicales bacterium]